MLMLRKSLTLLALVALAVPSAASADLFFSEYIEGSSFNKAVEIYNSTGAAVDLSDYELRLYTNGAAAPSQTVVLGGLLADGDVFVACHTSADPLILAVADLQSGSVINFNGDDSVELYKISTTSTVDAIGQFGVDPGSEWAAGGVSTANQTIRRKAAVCQGDTDGTDAFDPSIEWDSFAINTFSDLGMHTSACGPTPVSSSTWGRVKSLYR